jgi:shikimate kinase
MTGNIFLVGMMGAGKSTVGRNLAKRLDREFFDTDRILTERTGVPIATIFEYEGEPGFRARERLVIAEFAARDNAIVATGGGAILDEANRALMRESGTVIYLRAKLDDLCARTRRDTSRPLLATPDPRATLAALLEARDPLYTACAHLVVDTGAQSVHSLVSRILDQLGGSAEAATGT